MADLFPDPNSPPTQADILSKGADCCRHPLLGCIISHGNGTPEQQARDFLHSLRIATIHKIAGRAGDLSDAEYRATLQKLAEWERTNSVPMPPPIVGHPFAGAPRPAPRVDHAAEQARLAAELTAAMAEASGKITH